MTRDARYRRVAADLVEYVLGDLRHPAGGFFAAEDADSEGVEGKFYLWSLEEIEAVCGDDAAEVIRYFGVTPTGNFEDPHTGYRGNILHAVDRTEDRPDAVTRGVERLRAARRSRVRPGLDDKVLLGWNALFVRALAEAAGAFDRTDWLDAARATARFLVAELHDADHGWRHTWQDGRAQLIAYAEDEAALLEAFLSLAEVDDPSWLDDARAVADDLLDRFHDVDGGGFFSTAVDAEPLIVRPKDIQDGATPSANSLACHGLYRLAALTGESRYENPAGRWLRTMTPVLGDHPTAFAYLLGALERDVTAPIEVAVVGADTDAAALRRVVLGRLVPNLVTLSAPPGVGGERSPLLADRGLVDGHASAYVCEHFACRAPVSTPDALAAALDAAVRARLGGLATTEVAGEGLGHRPAVRDDRLALLGSDRADQLGRGLAAQLHVAGVENGFGAAVGLDPELAVVVAGVAAEAAGQAATPRSFLPVGGVLGAGAHVGELEQQRVRSRLGDPPGDEDVLVGEGDRGPPVQLTHERFEAGPGGAAPLRGSQPPQDAGGAADPFQRPEQEAVQVVVLGADRHERELLDVTVEGLIVDG